MRGGMELGGSRAERGLGGPGSVVLLFLAAGVVGYPLVRAARLGRQVEKYRLSSIAGDLWDDRFLERFSLDEEEEREVVNETAVLL